MTNKAGVIVIFMGGTPSKGRALPLLAAKGLNKAETGLARCSTAALRLYGVLHQRLKMLIDLEGPHPFYVSIFGGVEHLRGRSMFASWKKSYCPIGADRYDL